MSLERITESGRYVIETRSTGHISLVTIDVYETCYVSDNVEAFDKDLFHHLFHVREHLPDPYITPGDSPGGEAME